MQKKARDAGRAAGHIGAYLAVGACTTAVNVLAYLALREWWATPPLAANFVAWTASVAFAYSANRRFVYGSAARGVRARAIEAGAFLSSRAFSLVLDMALMWAGLEAIRAAREAGGDPARELALKLAVNAVVIAVNYLTGRLVFKYKGKNA